MSPRLALTALVLLAASGCAERVATARPQDFVAYRSYQWPTTTKDAQADWNPMLNQVVARAAGGFTVLTEGKGKQDYFVAEDKRDTGLPSWINHYQFVFGPRQHMLRGGDGTMVPSADGLTVITLQSGGQPSRRQLSPKGFRPRSGQGWIFGQLQDRMYRADEDGGVEELGPGFWPEPQEGADAKGLAWQTTPLVEPDLWTANPPLGRLVVRWRVGELDEYPACTEARWDRRSGGLLATRVRAEAPAGKPWWQAGTEVVAIDGPGAQLRVIASNARNADANPVEPVVAVQTTDGKVLLVSWDGVDSLELDRGENPRWNFDGTRLMFEQRDTQGGNYGNLKVMVFRINHH